MSDKKRIGLWRNTSAKGTEYLSGSDKEAGLRYMVFKDEKNGSRRLVSKPLTDNEAKLQEVATFVESETKDGTPFYRAEGHAIFANDFFEEGSNKPEFNLVIG